jgi:peptide/nickel transport system substrate-binding protein
MSGERVQPEAGQTLGTVRISRRDFLKIGGTGLVGATLLGVVGCGRGGGGQQGGGAQGNTIVAGIDQEPAVLNLMLSEGQLQVTNDAVAGIVQPPIAIQPDLSYKPVLAEAMPEVVSENPMILEYKLKDDLTWSDGEPLTSADAKWTFEQIVNPDNNIAVREGWDQISKFETPDERTVRMTFETPYAPWTDMMGNNYPILPKHIYEG